MRNGTEDLISLFTSLGCMRILSFASSGQITLRSTSSMGALSSASLDQGWTELEQPLQLLMLHMCGIDYNDPAGQGSKNEARFESWRDDRPSIYMQHLRDHDLWRAGRDGGERMVLRQPEPLVTLRIDGFRQINRIGKRLRRGKEADADGGADGGADGATAAKEAETETEAVVAE